MAATSTRTAVYLPCRADQNQKSPSRAAPRIEPFPTPSIVGVERQSRRFEQLPVVGDHVGRRRPRFHRSIPPVPGGLGPARRARVARQPRRRGGRLSKCEPRQQIASADLAAKRRWGFESISGEFQVHSDWIIQMEPAKTHSDLRIRAGMAVRIVDAFHVPVGVLDHAGNRLSGGQLDCCGRDSRSPSGNPHRRRRFPSSARC